MFLSGHLDVGKNLEHHCVVLKLGISKYSLRAIRHPLPSNYRRIWRLAGDSGWFLEVSSCRSLCMLATKVVTVAMLIIASATSGYFQDAMANDTVQKNVALSRPYKVEPAPNYETAQVDNGGILTDGKDGYWWFWRNGTSLGWSWRTSVTVSIDLQKPVAISHVQVQAGAKKSGEAYYPSQIFVYGGDGTGHYVFLGATGLQRDRESPSSGTLRNFSIRFPPHMVRKLVVLTFARGAFIWLSEIKAFGIDSGAEIAGKSADNFTSIDMVRADATLRRRKAIAALPIPKPMGPEISRRWTMPISNLATKANGTGQTGCKITRIDPWSEKPKQDSPITEGAKLLALKGGYDHLAFRISNYSDTVSNIRVVSAEWKNGALSWYALAHAQALDYSWVPDVVVPFKGGVLPPRSSMVIVGEVTPHYTGHERITFNIACADQSSEFDVAVQSIAPHEDVPPLHGNLWTYLHQPTHASINRALTCDSKFLEKFGINTVVVHPDALLDKDGERPTDLLKRYLRAYHNAPRVLLFMDVKMRPWAFRKMPDSKAAQTLRAWWQWLQRIAEEEKVTGELILYPIDEPQPKDVPLLLRTRDLFRQAGIKARVYSTVEHKAARLLTSLDILQLHRPSHPWRSVLKVSELHGYDTRHDGKLLSINNYYRMQGWRAFELSLTGIGIWSAWDSSGLSDPKSGWNPFVGKRERDFGLVYASPKGCGWPSRRLIAWRRGLEENRILRTCTQGKPNHSHGQHIKAAIAEKSTAVARRTLAQVVKECG